MTDQPPAADPQPNWVPILDAAKATGISERTVYRYARIGKVPSQTDPAKGATLVDVNALRQLVRPRLSPVPAPSAAAASVAAVGGGGKLSEKAALVDGEVAAQAFAAFDEGSDHIEAVQLLRIAPEKAKHLFAQWRAMRAESAGRVPLPREQLEKLSDSVKEISQKLGRIEADVQDEKQYNIARATVVKGLSDWLTRVQTAVVDRFEAVERALSAMRQTLNDYQSSSLNARESTLNQIKFLHDRLEALEKRR